MDAEEIAREYIEAQREANQPVHLPYLMERTGWNRLRVQQLVQAVMAEQTAQIQAASSARRTASLKERTKQKAEAENTATGEKGQHP